MLSSQKEEVNVNEISKKLEIKMPTVTSMVKKLASKDLVLYESYKPIRLTEKGLKEAALILRKHRLTEMFLVEKMGFGWEEVHEIAEQVEHIQSPEFFEKMDLILDFPKMDPHGSPIPDKDGNVEWKEYRKLGDCNVGETVTLAAVMHSSSEFLKLLNSRNLKLGSVVSILSKEPFDDSMVIKVGKQKALTLSQMVSARLLVAS